MSASLISRSFKSYSNLCTTRPWEVIFFTATLTLAIATTDGLSLIGGDDRNSNKSEYEDTSAVMLLIKGAAMLTTYHQFRQLLSKEKNIVIGMTGVFITLCLMLYSVCVVRILNCSLYDLKDTIFFAILVLDISKLKRLSSPAFSPSSSSTPSPSSHLQIAQSYSSLGAGITLDTFVEAVFLGAGTLMGVPLVSRIIQLAVLAIITNFITLMTFYPAILSLVLQMKKVDKSVSHCGNCRSPPTLTPSPTHLPPTSSPTPDTKSGGPPNTSVEETVGGLHNPVSQRLKVIVSAGIMTVHTISKFSTVSISSETREDMLSMTAEDGHAQGLIGWLLPDTEKFVCVLVLVALLIKYAKFDEKTEDLQKEESLTESQASNKMCDDNKRKCATINTPPVLNLEGVENNTNNSRKNVEGVSEDTKCLNPEENLPDRDIETCLSVMNSSDDGILKLSDSELSTLVSKKLVRGYKLESLLGDHERGVKVRRKVIHDRLAHSPGYSTSHGQSVRNFDSLPYQHYDYTKVTGVCCENVIGYVPIPVGVAGPLTINGATYYIPMATTEGCLVASTNRGCLALQQATSLDCRVFNDGMTRAPVVTFCSMKRADQVREWINQEHNQTLLKEAFNSTSNFARLKHVSPRISGSDLHLRFVATTGDAMGMNMVSKGAEASLSLLQRHHPDMKILSISGNMCTDKKPSAVNWILGRGKSVSCEAVIPPSVVKSVLKTSVKALVHTNMAKNLEGSALAGSIGGYNAHAANIVAAVFIACGQDPAQVVGSSNCMTKMEMCEDGSLRVSVNLPSLEVGTVGGGTSLGPQGAVLNMMGVKGAHPTCPGDNARQLSLVVAGAVLAGELSVLAALTAGHLVNSHLKMNRMGKESSDDNNAQIQPACSDVNRQVVNESC